MRNKHRKRNLCLIRSACWEACMHAIVFWTIQQSRTANLHSVIVLQWKTFSISSSYISNQKKKYHKYYPFQNLHTLNKNTSENTMCSRQPALESQFLQIWNNTIARLVLLFRHYSSFITRESPTETQWSGRTSQKASKLPSQIPVPQRITTYWLNAE